MFYVDSQRTLTRRDSSLVAPKATLIDVDKDYEALSTARARSPSRLDSESGVDYSVRPRGSVRKELVTGLFESMLDCIVESWEVIAPPKEESANTEVEKTPSELTVSKKKKTAGSAGTTSKAPKTKRSQSKSDFAEPLQVPQSWWSGPDERATIVFKNGNVFEGNISNKCMHGSGRFQWADGTVYLGQFKENEITGKGKIRWKDDTWYEGDFSGNMRHGRGLYVDSRRQRSYVGEWHSGTKHGDGAIYYSEDFKNSYDGEWDHNVRHGFGSREYNQLAGYKGDWDWYVREGKGLMIWPNHDFYRGEWKNGVMSGYGVYIWDSCYNNSMSPPTIDAYRGHWFKGQRTGYGILNFGYGFGAHYKGYFENNKKNGVGKLVTNNGYILQNDKLFEDDNLNLVARVEKEDGSDAKLVTVASYHFNMCDDFVGLLYHIERALDNLDKTEQLRRDMIDEFLENNKMVPARSRRKEEVVKETVQHDIEDLIRFEEISLLNAIKCYQSELRTIYHQYSTICNKKKVHFNPIMIRLYLWQLYYDCNMHEKGLTLVEIDNTLQRNPEWLSRSAHDPFEKIYYWQFIHSLISVGSKLHSKRELPGVKPDTILATAFRKFMDEDILPCAGRRKGRLVDDYGQFIPLKGLYQLYRSIGEPHTIRQFLLATRRPRHLRDRVQPPLHEWGDEPLTLGRNVYALGDDIAFVTSETSLPAYEINTEYDDLKLWNLGNLSSSTIIKIFAHIFPQVYVKEKIMDLDINMTFLEFYEAFLACAEESIRVKDEEMRWREKFSMSNDPTSPTGPNVSPPAPPTTATRDVNVKHK